mmetsp:Transcript_15062/g.30363  ORF Transcript_15062/g.30363 Transcript_15062/m.30363 type:complete len:439 (-) Transcript_15062:927-2243(-)
MSATRTNRLGLPKGMSARHPTSAAFAPNVYKSATATTQGNAEEESESSTQQPTSKALKHKLSAAAAFSNLHVKKREERENASNERPSNLKVWVLASRPHTLTASIAPVLVGAALTSFHDRNYVPVSSADEEATESVISISVLAILWASFACLIQLGTNLHNDYADFVKGADDHRRIGQARATQRGWLTPLQTASGATLCLGLASAIGLYLAYIAGTCTADTSNGSTCTSMYGLDKATLFIVATSVFNAVAYTGGPYPLGYIGLGSISIGYSGLGDIFVFLYFGLVATLGVPYLYLRSCGNTESAFLLLLDNELFRRALHAAIPVGNLATAIIVVNNLRDRKTDIGANKRTLAVRFGEWFARIEYAVLVLSSYAFLFALAKSYEDAMILPLLSLPVAMPQLDAVAFGDKDGSALNDHVGGTARLQLLFCLLLVLGIQLS